MDQVKKVLRVLMAQRFWIICGLITILPLGGWYTTTSTMRKTTQEKKNLIEGKFKDAQSVASKANHPNDTAHEGMDKLIERLRQEVGAAWRSQYEQQKNLLVWPAELGEDFIEVVTPMTPIEKIKFPTPPADELSVRLRERYRDYIKLDLPKLAQIIDAKWLVQAQAGGEGGISSGMSGSGMSAMSAMSGMAGMAGMAGRMPGYGGSGAFGSSASAGEGGSTNPTMVEDTSKVRWNPTDQTSLFARYDWSTRPGSVPRTVEVLYAQEDLWIMNAVMRIIAEANKDATANYNAIVKEISYISLGRASGGKAGLVMRVGQGGGTEGGGSMGMGMMGMGSSSMGSSKMGSMGMAMPSGSEAASGTAAGSVPSAGGSGGAEGMSGMMGGMNVSIDPADGRYVDRDYQPVPASKLRTAIESDARNEQDAYLLVAKRIPIRMGITVDQRKLNRFITACGNSTLMVEVRQVRFNRQSGPGSSGGGAFGGGMAGMGSMGMNMDSDRSGGMGGSGFAGASGFGASMMSGMMSGMAMSGESGGSSGMPAAKDGSGHDKPVEVFGVVYIYNTVDVKKLKLEEKPAAAAPATESAAPATTAAPATPDAATPPAATPATGTAAPATGTATPATGTAAPATGTATAPAGTATPAVATPAEPASGAAGTATPAAAAPATPTLAPTPDTTAPGGPEPAATPAGATPASGTPNATTGP